MKWIKSGYNQWYTDKGEYWLHITKVSGWYFVSRLDKDTKQQNTINKYYKTMSEAKQAAKQLEN